MRIATFNIEHLFFRHKELLYKKAIDTKQLGHEMDLLMCLEHKSITDLERMRELWQLLDYEENNTALEDGLDDFEWSEMIRKSKLADKRQYKRLYTGRGYDKSIARINLNKIKNKAKMISEVVADILVLQEVENQAHLEAFNALFLDHQYDHVLFIPTMDPLGRGMGLMYSGGYDIFSTKSFCEKAYAKNADHLSHGVQLYRIRTPKGSTLDVINLHFFNASLWKKDTSLLDNFLKKIIEWAKMEMYGTGHRIVAGNLNMESQSYFLNEFLRALQMTNTSKLKCFDTSLDNGIGKSYHGLGVYKKGVNLLQKDYILADRYLSSTIKRTGLNRSGVLPENKDQWNVYKGLNEWNQASTHPIIWIDF